MAKIVQRKRSELEIPMRALLARAESQLPTAAYRAMRREYQLQVDDALAEFEGELLSACRNASPTPVPEPPRPSRPPKLKYVTKRK